MGYSRDVFSGKKKEKENSWPSHRMIIPSSDA